MQTERFENIIVHGSGGTMSIFAVAGLQNFLGEKAHVDHTDDTPLLIDHGKGEEFVEHEKFAGVEHGRGRRNGDDHNQVPG